MNKHTFVESEDTQDFGEVMTRLFDMEEFEYEKCLNSWHDSGHTKTTATTFMSDDYDDDLDEMIDEDEPTFLIDTHSFDPPIPFNAFSRRHRSTSSEWSTLPCEENISIAPFYDDPMDIPSLSMALEPPSQSSLYNYSVFDHNCCEMAPTMFNPCSEQVDLTSPTRTVNMPGFRQLEQEPLHTYDERKLNRRSTFRTPCLVGDLNFDSFHVSRPVSSIHFLGKLSSPMEHPLAERVKSGLRNSKDKMQCELKKPPPASYTMPDNCNTANKGVSGGLGQKRCRRLEPIEKQYVEVTDNDVLLGRGGQSNRHPGNIVYRQHILEHQREYKLLKTDEKTEMSKEVVAWVKKRGGRFLKRDEEAPGQPFYIATDVTARQKVSQALREDHTPEGRQQKRSRTRAYQS